MADCMQFLSENCLNGRQIFGRFGFLKTKSKPNFSFPHIPSLHNTWLGFDSFTHTSSCHVTFRNVTLVIINEQQEIMHSFQQTHTNEQNSNETAVHDYDASFVQTLAGPVSSLQPNWPHWTSNAETMKLVSSQCKTQYLSNGTFSAPRQDLWHSRLPDRTPGVITSKIWDTMFRTYLHRCAKFQQIH